MRHSNRQAGFTLVELVIVLAITSLLSLIALIGQRQLQDRERFDAAVDKTIQNLAYARNYAMSNVNTEGSGNDPNALLVGVGLEFDNNHPSGYPLTELEPVYATPDANGDPDPNSFSTCPQDLYVGGNCNCPPADHPVDANECFEQFFSLSDTLTVANPGVSEVVPYFINTGQGLEVCHEIGTVWTSITAACAATRTTPLDIDLVDPSGLTATIRVDPVSGFAKRLN